MTSSSEDVRVRARLLLLVLGALLGACGPASETPLPEAEALPRVLSFSGELAAIVVELGLPAVELADACDATAESVGQFTPDLTLMLGDPCGLALAEALRRQGLPAAVFSPRSMNEVVEAYHRLGTLLNRERRANLALARIIREIGRIASARDGQTRLRVAWLIDRDPLTAVGGQGLLHELLELAGAENAFHEPGVDRVATTAAEIAARAPDRVFDSSTSGEIVGSLAIVERTPAELAALPVVDVLARVRALHELLYPNGGRSPATRVLRRAPQVASPSPHAGDRCIAAQS